MADMWLGINLLDRTGYNFADEFFVVVADKAVRVLSIVCVLIQPYLDASIFGNTDDVRITDVVASKLSVLVENISGYEGLDLFEVYYQVSTYRNVYWSLAGKSLLCTPKSQMELKMRPVAP
jgi:hypothetical protein